MKRIVYLLIMFLTSIIISPIDKDSLPDFYVEMLDSSGKNICSAFIINSNTIMTSEHCKNLTHARFRDGTVEKVMRVYKNTQDDVAIFHIHGNGYHLDEYPQLGYSFDFGLFRIHSHINNVQHPIFLIFIEQNLLQDVEDASEILTLIDILLPLGPNIQRGHSGSAVVQNGLIVGMVKGFPVEQLVPTTYSIQGMVLLKNLREYEQIIDKIK